MRSLSFQFPFSLSLFFQPISSSFFALFPRLSLRALSCSFFPPPSSSFVAGGENQSCERVRGKSNCPFVFHHIYTFRKTGCLFFVKKRMVNWSFSHIFGSWHWKKAGAQPPTVVCKNGSSVGICARCVHVFRTFAINFVCSVGA